MIAYCNRWLALSAAVYLSLLPTNAATYLRSVAFGATIAGALAVVAWTMRDRRLGRDPARITLPNQPLLLALAGWTLWSFASLAWSVDVPYTSRQLQREISDSLLMIAAFYIAAREVANFKFLVGAALASCAAMSVWALVKSFSPAGWDASLKHGGVGPWSTYVVLIAPMLLTTFAPAPIGLRRRWVALAFAVALLALIAVTARLTDNRMVWIALAAVFGVGAIVAAWRWPGTFARSSWRWLVPIAALMVLLGLAFVDTAREKAVTFYPPHTSVEETLRLDPRIMLWEHTRDLIRAKPWAGYGFGRRIVAPDLTDALRDPLITHAHNIFVSQWVQTGAVGLALFVALLGTLGWTFLGLVRTPDNGVATIGIVGLALLAGFVTKNLTDDFLFRSNAKEFWVFAAMLIGFGGALKERHQAALSQQPRFAMAR